MEQDMDIPFCILPRFEKQGMDTILMEYDQDFQNSNILFDTGEEKKIGTNRRKDKSEEKRLRHNKISQKGRQKINEEISKLKELLPECRYTHCNKATILQYAVSNLDRLSRLSNNLSIKVQNLQNENKKLWNICNQIALDFSQATGREYHDVISEYFISFSELSNENCNESYDAKIIYQMQNKNRY